MRTPRYSTPRATSATMESLGGSTKPDLQLPRLASESGAGSGPQPGVQIVRALEVPVAAALDAVLTYRGLGIASPRSGNRSKRPRKSRPCPRPRPDRQRLAASRTAHSLGQRAHRLGRRSPRWPSRPRRFRHTCSRASTPRHDGPRARCPRSRAPKRPSGFARATCAACAVLAATAPPTASTWKCTYPSGAPCRRAHPVVIHERFADHVELRGV